MAYKTAIRFVNHFLKNKTFHGILIQDNGYAWVPESSMTWLPKELIEAVKKYPEDLQIHFGFTKRLKNKKINLFISLTFSDYNAEETDDDQEQFFKALTVSITSKNLSY